MVNKLSEVCAARRRGCIALALVVAAFGVACSGQDTGPVGDFESAGVDYVHCQRTHDTFYKCHGGNLTVNVERS